MEGMLTVEVLSGVDDLLEVSLLEVETVTFYQAGVAFTNPYAQ